MQRFQPDQNVIQLDWGLKKYIYHSLLQNAFPVTGQLYTTHLLSLEALLTVIDSIKDHCQAKVINSTTHQDQSETLQAEGKGDDGRDTSTGIYTFAHICSPWNIILCLSISKCWLNMFLSFIYFLFRFEKQSYFNCIQW